MKLRAYSYKCRRCGEIWDEEDLSVDSELVADSVRIYAMPDEHELGILRQNAGDNIILGVSDLVLFSHHTCMDKGIGIADIAGCSPEYEGD